MKTILMLLVVLLSACGGGGDEGARFTCVNGVLYDSTTGVPHSEDGRTVASCPTP